MDPRRRVSRFVLTVSRLSALAGRGLYTEAPLSRSKTSLFIRHVDGGSSNIYEMELAALTGPLYDVRQYGIHFVVSPRHADLLLLTGPLTWNMRGPALAAFKAMPTPKRIVTVGFFPDTAGDDQTVDMLFVDSYAIAPLPGEMRAAVVDHIPGDPPTPELMIEQLLRLKTPKRRIFSRH